MATATKKARAPKQVARGTGRLSKRASMGFHIFEDNGGACYWRLVAGDGAPIAQSVSFGSYDDAVQAARLVRDTAGSASFEPRAGED